MGDTVQRGENDGCQEYHERLRRALLHDLPQPLAQREGNHANAA